MNEDGAGWQRQNISPNETLQTPSAPSKAGYEFKGESGGVSAYVHGKCEKCGKVVHIERKAVEAAIQGFSGGSGGFELDCSRTLFYGICPDCRREK